MSTIWLGDTIVGETTSGGYGHRVGKSIALGILRSDLHESGTRLEIEIFGQRHAATVHADEPLWDPQNERIRA
jgi:dimethylglycine dehydrogenase